MSDENKKDFEIVRINYLLQLACDKYIESVVEKCELNIKNWMNVFLDVIVNLCYNDNKVSYKNINEKIVPRIKLIHVYFCDYIYKLVYSKYFKKDKYFENICEIKKLIKIIKKHIKSKELDKLTNIIDVVSNSKQIVATLKKEYKNILLSFEKYIEFYASINVKTEIFLKCQTFNTNEKLINYLNSLTKKWIKENSTIESNSDIKLIEKENISKATLTQTDIKISQENSKCQDNYMNQSSQTSKEIEKVSWSKIEVSNLIDGIKEFGTNNWSKILNKYHFNNRTVSSLSRKYLRLIENYPDFHERISELNENNKSPFIQNLLKRRKHNWGDNEMKYLEEGIKEFGSGNWSKILKKFPFVNITSDNLRQKYKNIIKLDPHFFNIIKKK